MKIRSIKATLPDVFSFRSATPEHSESRNLPRTRNEKQKKIWHWRIIDLCHNHFKTITAEAAEQLRCRAVVARPELPIPLFKGTDTVYLPATGKVGISQQDVIIRTKDKPSFVAKWYREALVVRGQHPSMHHADSPGHSIYWVKAQSARLCLSIVIVGEEVNGSETQVKVFLKRR